MEKPNESVKILNMFPHPVFLVASGTITDGNDAAYAKGFTIGTKAADFLSDALEEYEAFNGGYLSLTVTLNEIAYLATVVRSDDTDVFHIRSGMTAEFRTMSLIAQQLRLPLSGVMAAADNLLPLAVNSGDPDASILAAQMSRNLYQLLRQISNLSASQQIAENRCYGQTHRITVLIDEVMDHAKTYVAESNHTLKYTGLVEDVQTIADGESIERALYNLISNAVKFSPEGTVVTAKLSRTGTKLRFSIANKLFPNADKNNLFARFMREPEIESSLHGIGLGLPLIQHVAASHGGSLLMDLPEENTVRFTMTLPIRQNAENVLRSPVMQFDYLGGYNHALVELSDILSDDQYSSLI